MSKLSNTRRRKLKNIIKTVGSGGDRRINLFGVFVTIVSNILLRFYIITYLSSKQLDMKVIYLVIHVIEPVFCLGFILILTYTI